MIETTPMLSTVEVAVNALGAPPMPVSLKPSPLKNFQIVGITGLVVAYGDDPAELIDWVTDSKLLDWKDDTNPAN